MSRTTKAEIAVEEYDQLRRLDWSYLCVDGTMGKAPLGGEKTGPNPTDRSKLGSKCSLPTEAAGVPLALVCAAANTSDHRLLESTLWGLFVPPPADKGGLCLD